MAYFLPTLFAILGCYVDYNFIMGIRSKDDFKLTGVFIGKEEWEELVFFTKAAGILIATAAIKALSFLTRFFPFSLIGQDMSFHSHNRDIRQMMGRVFEASAKAGREFVVESGGRDGYFYTINGYFVKLKKRTRQDSIIKKMERSLGLPKGSVFHRRSSKDKIRLLIPID